MELTLLSLFYKDSDFGTRTMCKFVDGSGNVVIWWASQSIEMPLESRIKAKATVKAHTEYLGVKQTIVSRLAVTATL